jgi:hypothetical protein
MPTVPEPQWKDLTLERRGDVFILTMRKAPENRINIAFAQEIISAPALLRRAHHQGL